MKINLNPLARVFRWPSAPICALLFAISLQAHSAENETNAVKYCIASGAVEPEAFAYCVGSYLTASEIKKCLTGGDCFGESNDIRRALERAGINFNHIQQYGWCGGPNSDARKIFGSDVCGCTGPVRKVKIENSTGQTVSFNAVGSCSDNLSTSVPAGASVTISGEGDEWFNVSVNSNGSTTEYGLNTGLTYAFQWEDNQLKIFNSTPRFTP